MSRSPAVPRQKYKIMDSNPNENIISEVTNKEYEYGFVTDIETDFVPKGLNEDIIRLISKKKEEPEWLLEFRLKAFRHWQTLKQPNWAHLDLPEINYQDIIYYAAPRKRQEKQSLDEVDPELLSTFENSASPSTSRRSSRVWPSTR